MQESNQRRRPGVDILRGLIMAVMVLDHARDFYSDIKIYPTNLDQTYPALFFTRWITHFCAPVFIFLAGLAIYFQATRTPSSNLRRFLFTRGLWLVFLEVTVIHVAWQTGDFGYHFLLLQTMWAIGVSMMGLSLLIRLRPGQVGAIGLAIVLMHNLLDSLHVAQFGKFGFLWSAIHERARFIPFAEHRVVLTYPVLPWLGVMACGYGFGTIYGRISTLKLGATLSFGFLLLRGFNLYGDPHPWVHRPEFIFRVMSFLNCEKYPPSLLYLLMTLGPALLFLGAVDRMRSTRGFGLFQTFGQVPLFFYILHLYLISYGALAVEKLGWPINGLAGTYFAWIITLVPLYVACRWYQGIKRANPGGWLRYL